MAKANLIPYICFETILKNGTSQLGKKESRNNTIGIFSENKQGGWIWEKK